MPRFHRFSVFSARCLYERQVARAWRCFALAAVGVSAVAAVLLVYPCWPRGGAAVLPLFRGVVYAEPAAAPVPQATVRRRPWTVAEPPAVVPLPRLAVQEPAAVAQESWETGAEGLLPPDEPFCVAEELVPLPAKSPSAAETVASVAPRPAAGRGKALSAPQAAPSAAVVKPAAYRSAPQPPYPPAMRERRLAGSVGVRINVSAEGHPTGVLITSSGGHSEFDNRTREWILKNWRFYPATQGGVPVPSVVTTRVNFVL